MLEQVRYSPGGRIGTVREDWLALVFSDRLSFESGPTRLPFFSQHLQTEFLHSIFHLQWGSSGAAGWSLTDRPASFFVHFPNGSSLSGLPLTFRTGAI